MEVHVNVRKSSRRVIASVSLAMVGLVFAIDLRSQLGINIPLLYILPVVLSLWQSRQATFIIAATATALTAVRVFWFSSGYWSIGVTNRALTLLAIWLTAAGVAERKRTEARLQQQAELARLGEMAMVIAHEVRNAVGGIRAVVDVVSARLSHADRDQAIRDEMTRRVSSLEQLMTDLLTLWRPMQPVVAPSALMPVVQRAVDLLKRDPQFAGITVEAEGADVMLPIDEKLVQSALANLLLNAAQAMNGAGTIRLAIERAGQTCRISIRDAGPGIPPEVKPRIFDAFFTTKNRGTGLGLPIAKRAVEWHGGLLTLESAVGVGTTAIVTLPLTTDRRHRYSDIAAVRA